MSEDIKIRGLVITEDMREFSTDIEGDAFTVRIPLPYQKAQQTAQVARALGGQKLDSIPFEEYELIRSIVVLNNNVVSHPDWWKGADQCPDEELLSRLYRFYLDSETKFQESLKKNNGTGKLTQ